jgi:Ca2+-binding EF-hand superfamily protein
MSSADTERATALVGVIDRNSDGVCNFDELRAILTIAYRRAAGDDATAGDLVLVAARANAKASEMTSAGPMDNALLSNMFCNMLQSGDAAAAESFAQLEAAVATTIAGVDDSHRERRANLLARIENMFQRIDVNGDENIDRGELQNVLKSIYVCMLNAVCHCHCSSRCRCCRCCFRCRCCCCCCYCDRCAEHHRLNYVM